MFFSQTGHTTKLWPHGTHTLKCPQGTNANARFLIEHTTQRVVEFVVPCCVVELDED